ncbi:MAG: LPXTG cell wall anchor domain-containing protein, partial [Gemella haemolysans]|uniref:mucin-binding protein n=1 Tax=Gemella haemolysans TaxID=1379 RepID=UPI0026F361A9
KVPVIPHIPGTTPQVPKDPTKPVDPNTNPLVPLKPIDPQDPSKGYEVPPVPTDSTTNTPVNYVKDGQKAITNFVDNNGKVVSDPVVDQGDSGSKFTKSGEVESKIKELAKKGYVVTSNEYPSDDKDRVFDNDKDKDQIFNVKVTPLIVPTDPNSPDKPMVPTDPTKPVGPNNPLRPVTPSTPEPGKPVFPEDPNSPVWPETVKDMVTESSAVRTITYVDQNGKEVAATHTETIKFKRSAKVNLVTGEITYGEWSVVGDDTILDGNKLPKVDGYIARGGDIKESQEDIKATVGTNITQTVVYDKLGSWVPKVPENATPVPPITYPNDPTDPTKPGTDKPRVPHVPGFIPVGPDGTPLKTVDPKDPSKGYEVPDVPTDPTKDTPISYVPVTPEKPTPERINPKPTPVVPVQPEGPVTPATPKAPAKAGRLANTGTTETNTGLAGLGLGILGVLLAAARRRKEKNKN